MKHKILNVLLVFILLLSSSILVQACKPIDPTDPPTTISYDKYTIDSFNTYVAIGVGETNISSQSVNSKKTDIAKNNYIASNNKKGHGLVGKKQNGSCEYLKFKDKNNNEKTQELQIISFVSLNKYILISCVTTDEFNSGNYTYSDTYTTGTSAYIIDRAGRMYAISDEVSTAISQTTDYQCSTNCVYFYYDSGIKKLYTSNNELVIEEIINTNNLSTTLLQSFFVDKYDNVFITESTHNDTFYYDKTKPIYILKQGETLLRLNKLADDMSVADISRYGVHIYRALNGCVYLRKDILTFAEMQTEILSLQVFDSNGEPQDSSFMPSAHITMLQKNLIKVVDNTKYYFSNGVISKVTFSNETEYSIETIATENATKYVITDDKIYFLNNDSIFFITIIDGQKSIISSDYIFNDIWENSDGNICFKATNTTLDIVTGTINIIDNTIDTSIAQNSFEILRIKPLW